ncbi:MAG: NAD(P)H-dependent oxidoreductase [Haliea sp.]
MTRILYIEASPRGEASFSSRAAAAFLDAYRAQHPADEVDHLPLFEAELPAFGREGASQKMVHIARLITEGKGLEGSGEWAGVIAAIERFRSADKVLISSAMWNFSIPYPLKHYIDLICQPGLTFAVNRRGEYVGMVKGKPMQLILARGSEYRPGFPAADDGTKTDFQHAYLLHIARLLGFEDIRSLLLQPTEARGAQHADAMLAAALEEARQAAATF